MNKKEAIKKAKILSAKNKRSFVYRTTESNSSEPEKGWDAVTEREYRLRMYIDSEDVWAEFYNGELVEEYE